MMSPVLMVKVSIRLVQRFTMRFTVGFRPFREVVAYSLIQLKQPKPLVGSEIVVFEHFERNGLDKELAQKGCIQGLNVRAEQVEKILEFCNNNRASLSLVNQARLRRENVYISVKATKPPIPGVSYYNYHDVHNKCQAVRDIVFNKELLSIARNYLGSEPTLLFSNIIWTFPVVQNGARVDEEGQFGFHFDIPDFKSLAVFVYLNDVDEDTGPHVLIEGTHRRKPVKSLFINTLSSKAAVRKYADRIKVFTGKKGTTVIEDIYAYHKATNPRKPRLALKFFYGVQRSTMIHNRNLKDFAVKK